MTAATTSLPIQDFAGSAATVRPLPWYRDVAALTLALSIFGFPLAAISSSFIGLSDNIATVGVRALVAGLAGILFLQQLFKRQLNFVDGALCLYALALAARLIWDGWFDNRDAAHFALLFFALTTFLPAIVIGNAARLGWNDRNVVLAMLFIGFGTVLLALIVQSTGIGILWADQTTSTPTDRLGFERINPISLGTMAGTTLLIAYFVFLNDRDTKVRVMMSGIMALSLILVYLAASRGPIVSLFGTIAFAALVNRRAAISLSLGILAFIAAVIFSVVDLSGLATTLRFDVAGSDVNSTSRLDYIAEAYDAFLQSPVYGRVFELPISGGWPHNYFVEVLMSTGLIGMAIFLVPVTRGLFESARIFKIGGSIGAVLFIQNILAGQFSGSMWAATNLWIGLMMLRGERLRIQKISKSPESGQQP